MAKNVTTGSTSGTRLTIKGIAIIFVIALLAGMTAIFLANNVKEVQQATGKRINSTWYNPLSWF